MQNNIKIGTLEIKKEIFTGKSGYDVLIDFYNEASKYQDTDLDIHITARFIEGNLCALWAAINHELKTKRNVNLVLKSCLNQDVSELFLRNGFFSKNAQCSEDIRKSVVKLGRFQMNEITEFNNYIKQELLGHRGLDHLAEKIKKIIRQDITELFNNVEAHAQTPAPIFVCGQYFPKQFKLKLTIVDLGIGFLPAIQEKTNITNASEAVMWALTAENTTKEEKGGSCLSGIKEYFDKNNEGEIHIITSGIYWKSKTDKTTTIEKPFIGTTIHLIFDLKKFLDI